MPGIGNDFYVFEFIHCRFKFDLEIRACTLVQFRAVVPEDNVTMLQVMDEITSRVLMLIAFIKTCVKFAGIMWPGGGWIRIIFARIAISRDVGRLHNRYGSTRARTPPAIGWRQLQSTRPVPARPRSSYFAFAGGAGGARLFSLTGSLAHSITPKDNRFSARHLIQLTTAFLLITRQLANAIT